MSCPIARADDLMQRIRPPVPQWSHLEAWRLSVPLYWGGFLLRPDVPRWDRSRLPAMPVRSGVYALFAEAGAVLYVGRSGCLQDRVRAHDFASRGGRCEWWDRFMFRLVPPHALEAVEIAHIHALQPERNELYEPAKWPGHDAMVSALRAAWGLGC